MYKHFIEETRVNPLDKMNPPKYLESLKGFLEVFKDLNSQKKRIESALEELKDFMASEFWSLYELEEKLEVLESKYEKAKSYKTLLSYIEKIESLKDERRKAKSRIATAEKYVELFEKRAKEEVSIIDHAPKRRQLYISDADKRRGHKPHDIIQGSREVKFNMPPTLNNKAMEEIKKALPDAMREKLVSSGKTDFEKNSFQRRLIMKLKIADGARANITNSQIKEIKAHAYNQKISELKEDYLESEEVSWKSVEREEKVALYRSWQKQAEKYADQIAEAKQDGIIDAPTRDEDGFTMISIPYTNSSSEDLMNELDAKFEALKINYGLQNANIRLDSISIVDRRFTERSLTKYGKSWVDAKTGEILGE